MEIHFRPKKRQRKSPDDISILFSFSYIQSPSQPHNGQQYLVQFRLFAGDHCWGDYTVLMYTVYR